MDACLPTLSLLDSRGSLRRAGPCSPRRPARAAAPYRPYSVLAPAGGFLSITVSFTFPCIYGCSVFRARGLTDVYNTGS